MTLNEAIAESFSYKRRTSRGTQTPCETIERQEGTCRDFAFLMMEAARSLGFAARFVTGYPNLRRIGAVSRFHRNRCESDQWLTSHEPPI